MQNNLRRLGMIYSMGLLLCFVAEFALFIWVAITIGWWTLAIVMGTSLLGLVFIRRETRKAWEQLRSSMAAGVVPVGNTATGVLIFVGALLLLMPGFLGNILGLLLVIPPTRKLFARLLGAFGTRIAGPGMQQSSTVIRGDVVQDQDSDVHEGTIIPPALGPGEEESGQER